MVSVSKTSEKPYYKTTSLRHLNILNQSLEVCAQPPRSPVPCLHSGIFFQSFGTNAHEIASRSSALTALGKIDITWYYIGIWQYIYHILFYHIVYYITLPYISYIYILCIISHFFQVTINVISPTTVFLRFWKQGVRDFAQTISGLSFPSHFIPQFCSYARQRCCRQRLMAPSTLHAKRRSISGSWQLGKARVASFKIWIRHFIWFYHGTKTVKYH